MRWARTDGDRTSRLPDPAVLHQAAADRETERVFQQAYRFLARRQYAQAQKALQHVDVIDPANPHVKNLKARIRGMALEERERAESLRSWRYTLGMNTTWRRVLWAIAGIGLAVYSLSQLPRAIAYAVQHGLAAYTTTQVYRGGRYGPGRYVDWTRPIYFDLFYQGLLLTAALVVLFVLFRVSRGAAQWEELDAGDAGDGF